MAALRASFFPLPLATSSSRRVVSFTWKSGPIQSATTRRNPAEVTWFAYMRTSRRSKVEMEIWFDATCKIARLNALMLSEIKFRVSVIRFRRVETQRKSVRV